MFEMQFLDTVIAQFHTIEEKGSDLNLAAPLSNDERSSPFHLTVVVSNDTDLPLPAVLSRLG